jgi:hypothetical protein
LFSNPDCNSNSFNLFSNKAMTDQHPITPPLELVHQWADMLSSRSDHAVFSLAARWGADMELEACCEWVSNELSPDIVDMVRAARRPKPPSLKEQALAELELLRGDANSMGMGFDAPAIRRALEALPND